MIALLPGRISGFIPGGIEIESGIFFTTSTINFFYFIGKLEIPEGANVFYALTGPPEEATLLLKVKTEMNSSCR